MKKNLFSRMRARPIISLVGVVALVIAAGLGVTAWALDDDSIDTTEIVNQAGGYRLEVPEDWQSTQRGRTTTVTSPGKEALLRVGAGAAGPLPKAGAILFQQVRRNYRDVQLLGVDGKEIGGKPALVYAGIGTNRNNARVRFLAITVAHQPTNYGISVVTGAGSDPQIILPRVNTVVGSFRTLP